jgi:hypothetical protein
MPDRGTCAFDEGSFVLNLKACVCGIRCQPKNTTTRISTSLDSDDEETQIVDFEHTCNCGHTIAKHYFKEITGKSSVRYLMQCALCGSGATEKILHHSLR